MTDTEAVQKIAEVLYHRAQAAGTGRGILCYQRRAAYLLSIDRQLEERFESVVDAAVSGGIESIPTIQL